MRGIFISYRQDDAKPWALLLREELVSAFGEAQVFLDKDTLHAGNWREQIREALDRCGVVLVVMGRSWLTIADEHGERRLDRADDIHRQEIAHALSRKDIAVIPVRVDGAPMPRPADLPPALRSLAEQQARDLSDSSAHREVDLKLLIEDIERATGLTANRASRMQDRGARPGEMPRVATRARLPVGALVGAMLASIVLLVLADLSGWSLDAREESFVVFVVLCVALGVRWVRNRPRGKIDARG